MDYSLFDFEQFKMKNTLKWLFITGLVLSGIGLLRIVYYQGKAGVAQMMILSAWEESQT
ncbi:MAG: hypothetical protein ACJAS9_003471, partial [Polaribacter sp.]